jgi:hypothetical protein
MREMWLAIKVSAAQESVRCLVIQHTIALHSEKAGPRLDEYIKDPTFKALPPITKLLTPNELREWSDDTLLLIARYLRSRRMELDCELKRRGFLEFRW